MGKYVVRVFETTVYEYEIDADSEESAVEVAQEAYDNDDSTFLLQTWSERDESYPYVREVE